MTVEEERVERIVEKVEYVEESLELLVTKQSVGRDAYVESRELKDVVERRLQTTTQACIDIARLMLVDLDTAQPDSNAGTMRELRRQGVLTDETAEKMANACRFRNVLAHEYGHVIDDERVYDALQDLDRYRTFLLEVRDFLREEGAL